MACTVTRTTPTRRSSSPRSTFTTRAARSSAAAPAAAAGSESVSVQVVLAKKDPHLRLAVKLLAMTSEALALITNLKNKSQAVVLPAFGLTLWGSKGEASGTTPQTDGEEKGPDGAFFYLGQPSYIFIPISFHPDQAKASAQDPALNVGRNLWAPLTDPAPRKHVSGCGGACLGSLSNRRADVSLHLHWCLL